MDPIKTGKVIYEARKSHGLTQRELAKQISVSDKAVSKWERGLSFPDITVLIPLSEILGVSLYDLLKGEITNATDAKISETSKLEPVEAETVLKSAIEHYSDESKKKRIRTPIIVALVLSTIVVVHRVLTVMLTYNYHWSWSNPGSTYRIEMPAYFWIALAVQIISIVSLICVNKHFKRKSDEQ